MCSFLFRANCSRGCATAIIPSADGHTASNVHRILSYRWRSFRHSCRFDEDEPRPDLRDVSRVRISTDVAASLWPAVAAAATMFSPDVAAHLVPAVAAAGIRSCSQSAGNTDGSMLRSSHLEIPPSHSCQCLAAMRIFTLTPASRLPDAFALVLWSRAYSGVSQQVVSYGPDV